MKRFWETVTGPILEVVKPKTIVEIGTAQGSNTEKLLKYCHWHDATLHVIDPAPGYDVEEWQQKYGKRLVFHKDLSLQALPEIEGFDMVLIDGDHNWYTVFNELKLIEKTCEERSQGFPLVILHDIGWPYGRRDLYYDPDTIPEEHRQPYDRKGMRLGAVELLEKDGFNSGFPNALWEGGPRNGVLTAIEDFLNASRHELELLKLPGIHGLGILAPVKFKEQHPEVAALLDNLNFSPFVKCYIEGVEKARLEIEIGQQEERREHRKNQQRLTQENRELREEYQKLREERQRVKEMRHELNVANQNVLQLTQWLETLDKRISDLSRSRQWKVGSAVGKLYRRTTFKSGEATIDEHLEKVLQKFRAWRRDRRGKDQN